MFPAPQAYSVDIVNHFHGLGMIEYCEFAGGAHLIPAISSAASPTDRAPKAAVLLDGTSGKRRHRLLHVRAQNLTGFGGNFIFLFGNAWFRYPQRLTFATISRRRVTATTRRTAATATMSCSAGPITTR